LEQSNNHMKITKQYIKNLISNYLQAQEACKHAEKEAREKRAELDLVKETIIMHYNDGDSLKCGNQEIIVTQTERAGYTVQPSIRTAITIKQ
jgi:hypothetical protein